LATDSEVVLSGIRVGIQLAGLRLPFRKALEAASRLRADCIEIDARTEVRPDEMTGSASRQLRKLLGDLNLKVGAIRYATSRGYETTDELDRRIEGTQKAMKLAFELGANVVLSDLGKYSQRVGAVLALETGAESLTTLGQLVDSLPQASVGIALNPGNLIVNGFSLDDLPSVAQHVMLVHAKDGLPDRARGRGTQVPLGQGLAEFPRIMACLAEHSYRGCYIVERDMASDPISEFGASIKYLKSL
jgi:sugar phosphate isomerase/epimerase